MFKAGEMLVSHYQNAWVDSGYGTLLQLFDNAEPRRQS